MEPLLRFMASVNEHVVEPAQGKCMSYVARFSRILNAQFSMDGFNCGTKALISTSRLVNYYRPGAFGDKAIEVLERHKDIIYATLFFTEGGIGGFVKVVRDDEGNFERVQFQWAGYDKGGWYEVTIKVIVAFGHFCETALFLKKQRIYNSPFWTGLSESVSNYELPILGMKVQDTPWVENIARKPKDFFVVIAEGLVLGRYTCKFIFPAAGAGRFTQFEGIEYVKIMGSLGKIYLISANKWHVGERFFTWVDFLTQGLSQAKFIYETERKRKERFDRPATAA